MSLFDLQDVCIAIGSLATLDLPMVVDLIGIYGLKGPYCTLTTTNWFLQALSVIPMGSWGDVTRRSYHDPMGKSGIVIPEPQWLVRATQIYHLPSQHKQLLKDRSTEKQQLGATNPTSAILPHLTQQRALNNTSFKHTFKRNVKRSVLVRGVQRYHQSCLPSAIEEDKLLGFTVTLYPELSNKIWGCAVLFGKISLSAHDLGARELNSERELSSALELSIVRELISALSRLWSLKLTSLDQAIKVPWYQVGKTLRYSYESVKVDVLRQIWFLGTVQISGTVFQK
ncbi:hypothetical protein F511_34015 [Dorcoceras hygrometricum]|uniref:Helicase domain-containing family protein n=1 Tax=Dorcoceras hygrometricum TaxID=472368 RepID=A0A2Z7CIR3_9LAMI|nr:hypothetical protein F511_34015 [Dorcoceras hygrometricum]